MVDVDVDVPLSVKLGKMWVENKPLFILMVVGTSLLILGIIFCIVWFLVIVPNKNKNNEETTKVQAAVTVN